MNFTEKLRSIFTGSVMTNLIDIGYQVGLFEASKAGPATSAELAERAGLHERYVREWLGAMVTSGIYDYDPASREYSLPEDHAECLTGNTSKNFCPTSRILNHFGTHLPKLIHSFREGGGVPYEDFRPEFTSCMDDSWRRIYDEKLIDGFIAAVDGAAPLLEKGIRVLDIGCGTGHAGNVLAAEYPQSTFFGYDFADDAIEQAMAEAEQMKLTNSHFKCRDVTKLPENESFDLILAFDAVHDQRDPAAVLKSVHDALAPDGTFLMIDFKFHTEVHENIGNPMAALYYGTSLMHCTTVSLAAGGPGLGAVWGVELATKMLHEAGFAEVTVVDAPRPQNCIYVCRRGE